MEGLKYDLVPVSDLRPYPKNAKKHTPEQIEYIANSIREFGFRQPVVVDGKNVVVIGHGRLLAAKKLGIEKVPVSRADDLTPQQIKALRLIDNKTNEADWDTRALNDELAELRLDINMDDFGFLSPVGDESEDKTEPGEVPFSEELLLTHNYIVLYFDNDFDWNVAVEKFGLQRVRDLIPRKNQPTGIGRVIPGKRVLEWQS